MLQTSVLRQLGNTTKRAALAAALWSLASPLVFGQVTDLPSSTLDRSGNVIPQQNRSVRQVIAQLPPVPDDPSSGPDDSFQQSPLQPQPLQAPLQLQPSQPQPLNVDPNAPIGDLLPPQPPPPAAANQNFGPRRSAGAVQSSFSSAPTMMGDFSGGFAMGFSGSQTEVFNRSLDGTIISGSSGDPNAIIAFEAGSDPIANDIFTTGTGVDQSGDSLPDTFGILEPVPPSDALTSPGLGFVFDGGTATYTQIAGNTTAQDGIFNSGERWLVQYSYTSTVNGSDPTSTIRPVPGPGISARRVKLSENFSPDVRDRFFANYNFFNDAFGGLGDISRYVLGVERVLVDNLISVEFRLPMAGTYASSQELNRSESRDFEFGNATLVGKGILLRTDRFVWSGGLGVALPTADDTILRQGGQKILEIRNRSVHILPFTGLLFKKDANTFFQGYLQGDIAANGDPVFGNLMGGALPKLGEFNDSSILHADVAANRVIYRNHCAPLLRQVIANAELHYTGTLEDSDSVSNGSLTYANLKRNFNIVNATFGAHFVLGDRLVMTPGMAIPLRDGLDEQFDYEALLQLNYLR